MRRKRTKADGGVGAACEDLLTAERLPWYRMNSGKIVIPNGNGTHRAIRLNPKGTPDYLFHMPFMEHLEYVTMRVVWVECKRPGESTTTEQLAFADAARLRGETWLLIDDPSQLQVWLKEQKR